MHFLAVVTELLLLLAITLASMCWKKTQGRGVGTIPGNCDLGQEKQGLLCYEKCKSGYSGFLFVCSQNCPSGFRNDGLFCFKPAPYGRGAGYPWKFGDPLNDSKMFKRCRKANPGNPCEKHGLIVYPKCREGFHNVGCCICSPNCLNGMKDIGISCAKKTYTRKTILPNCGSKEYDAGLCYKHCPSGYNGVGPVCWRQCTGNHPVNCGMACASSKQACFDGTFEKVTSVFEVVANIAETVATGGTSTAAKASAKIAIKTAMKSLKNMTKKEIKEKLRKAAKEAGVSIAEGTLDAFANAAETGEFDWTLLDPTGIAEVVKAYTHKIC